MSVFLFLVIHCFISDLSCICITIHCIYVLSSVFQDMPPIIGMTRCPVFEVLFRCYLNITPDNLILTCNILTFLK